jgi:sulfite exporter TauE/SafE/copper chaperone CopZ
VDEQIETVKLYIEGMTCANCENRISRGLAALPGVLKAEVSYAKSRALITYDANIIGRKDIAAAIAEAGYQTSEQAPGAIALDALFKVWILYMLVRHLGLGNLFDLFPTAEAGGDYSLGALFLLGLLTSLHCLAMCGGLNLSQCLGGPAAGGRPLRPSLLYNLGRVISYTAIGAVVGALGSVISLSGDLKGLVQIVAGLFMLIMGINMLGVFPALRRLTLPAFFHPYAGKSGRGPLYVGLLNGFMPCGPLQAMQLYALSTGDPATGALSMLAFSLGTLPLMFGLGALSSFLSRAFTRKAMSLGAILIIFLGLTMFQSGLALSNFGVTGSAAAAGTLASVEGGVQVVRTALAPGRYEAITVKAGLPVKWTISAPSGSINGCNNRMFIPAYKLEHRFQPGDNLSEFTPDKAGTFSYSCWMGMIRSSITVLP